ncbi:hypothetical protein P7K49_031000 [Saguinus oedipus]|uniref:Uncharacterized protein n=1 Tax=Saguinus oedipus TaxID=9490 RepID=A0ABQ9U4H7_SAGOE|nr:hypothetical protein P7K49_031000 [Saguinus oedipus]
MHCLLKLRIFVPPATSQATLTATLSTTETATALPEVATTDANETDFTEIVGKTTPSSSTALSSTSPIIDTNSSFTIPTPNATGNESTTDTNLLSTPDIIFSSTSDVFNTTVTSKTQSNNEVSPSTKDSQSSGPSTSTASLETSNVNTTGKGDSLPKEGVCRCGGREVGVFRWGRKMGLKRPKVSLDMNCELAIWVMI